MIGAQATQKVPRTAKDTSCHAFSEQGSTQVARSDFDSLAPTAAVSHAAQKCCRRRGLEGLHALAVFCGSSAPQGSTQPLLRAPRKEHPRVTQGRKDCFESCQSEGGCPLGVCVFEKRPCCRCRCIVRRPQCRQRRCADRSSEGIREREAPIGRLVERGGRRCKILPLTLPFAWHTCSRTRSLKRVASGSLSVACRCWCPSPPPRDSRSAGADIGSAWVAVSPRLRFSPAWGGAVESASGESGREASRRDLVRRADGAASDTAPGSRRDGGGLLPRGVAK